MRIVKLTPVIDADWETRPSSPSSIRLISFGKLLDDKSPVSGMFLSQINDCYGYRLGY